MNHFEFFNLACSSEYPFALDHFKYRDKCSDAANWLFPAPPVPEMDENGNLKDRKDGVLDNAKTIPCPHYPTPCTDAAGEWMSNLNLFSIIMPKFDYNRA